jgi:hypothetical protein
MLKQQQQAALRQKGLGNICGQCKQNNVKQHADYCCYTCNFLLLCEPCKVKHANNK